MADVQLEHGYLKLANRLIEALACAPFSGTQQRVLLCFVRLTYGWHQRSVRLSNSELAARCQMRLTGGFRRQFHLLLREGVILKTETPTGRTAATYAINKDFENWGRFSIAESTLESLYRERPISGTSLPPRGQSTTHPPQRGDAPAGLLKATLQGQSGCPQRDTIATGKSRSDEGIAITKDKEIQERQLLVLRAEKFAMELTSTANNAVAQKWGEHTRSRPLCWKSATELCLELLQNGVDPELACQVVDNCIARSKKPQPPRAIGYFAEAITDAHKAAQQRALDARYPRRPSRPTRVHAAFPSPALYSGAKDREEHALRKPYEVARTEAGIAWGKDPRNAEQLQAISEELTAVHAATIGETWGQFARDTAIVLRCADVSGFPSFEDWVRDQRQHPPTERLAAYA